MMAEVKNDNMVSSLSNLSTSKAISIGMIMKVGIGNVNAGWTEGIVTVIKKVERPDGFFHPYISGQALRRYIRDVIKDIVKEKNDASLQMSPEEKGIDKKSPIVTAGDPRQYIDDDLFGFMKAIRKQREKKKTTQDKTDTEDESSTTISNTSEGNTDEEEKAVESTGTRKRASPLRVSPAFGLFKLNSDRDLGTRSAIDFAKSADAGGSIFETEITNNLFRCSLLLELDRVGVWEVYETIDPKDKDGAKLEEKSRKERISILLESLKYLWGGGRQTRFLVDLTPQFIIYARMRRKVPLFLNSVDVEYISDNTNVNYRIKTEILKEAINDYQKDIQSIIVGIRSGQYTNSKADFEHLFQPEVQIMTVGNAIDSMVSDIRNAALA